jgi:6-phosphogluconolactonase (cycloisomerase 2 family)
LTGSGLVITDTVSGATTPVTASATTYTVDPAVATGATYAITVSTQPSTPTQSCTVGTPNSGTVGSANVSVAITCTTSHFSVGGTISGLSGSGLVIKDTVSGVSTAAIASSATTFTVDPSLASGTAYTLIVATQPSTPTQSCTVGTGGSSTVGGANVSVAITCTTSQFTISGTISGLTGTGLIVKDNTSGKETAALASGATSFTITGVNSGTAYSIVIPTQPATPTQFCRVANATGTLTTANITGVSVACLNVGQFVFVANPFDTGNGSVAAFAINQATGAITAAAGSPYATTQSTPYALAVDPTGGFLYVLNNGSATVSADAIGTGGALTLDSKTPASTGASTNQPLSLAVDPAGPYVFVSSTDSSSFIGTIEAYTSTAGVLAPLGGTLTTGISVFTDGAVPIKLAFDPLHSFLYSTDDALAQISGYQPQTLTTPAGELAPLTWSPQAAAGTSPFGVAVHPSGLYVYVTDNVSNTLTEYDASATTLTVANTYTTSSTVKVGTAPEGIAVDPTGHYLYVSDSAQGKVSAYVISQTDGSLTAVTGSPFVSATGSGVPTVTATTAISIDPSGQFLYVANGDAGTVSPFTIGAGGVLTPIGPSNALTPVATSNGGGGPQALAVL